jgi:hypothetical protein
MRLYATVAKATEYTADVELIWLFGASAIIYYPNYSGLADYILGVGRVRAMPGMSYASRGSVVGRAQFLSARAQLIVPTRAIVTGVTRLFIAGEIRRLRNTGTLVRGQSRIATLPMTIHGVWGYSQGTSQSYTFVSLGRFLGGAQVYGSSRLSASAPTSRATSASAFGRASAFGQLTLWKNITLPIFGQSSVVVTASEVQRQTQAIATGVSNVWIVPDRQAVVNLSIPGNGRVYTGTSSVTHGGTAAMEGKSQFTSTADILDMTNLIVDPTINSPISDPQGEFLSSI